MRSPEVVVVGGRVAGAATALLLARLGHDVLVVDRTDPGSDTLSTHALMRPAVLQLHRWGVLDAIVAAGTPAIERITLGFGDGRVSFDLKHDFGVRALYAPRRTVLDSALLAAAVKEGVEFRAGTRARAVTRDIAGRVDGVVLDTGGNQTTMRSRCLVGADGMTSRVAEMVGATTYESYRPTSSVIYGYFEGVEAAGYEFQFTPGAGSGIIPTNTGLVNVFASWPSRATSTDTESWFHRVLEVSSPAIAARVRAGVRVGRFRRSPGVPGFLRTPGGPGWALVGDAGSTKDPITAHGISDALRDAELTARAVHRSLVEPGAEASAFHEYRATRDRFALPLLREGRALASYRWDAEEASARLRTLSAISDDECRFLTSQGAADGLAA
jgi:2-polyprenyl-6-methoxyphenol hydroxylase-like FAD-dependent oxidoreductase